MMNWNARTLKVAALLTAVCGGLNDSPAQAAVTYTTLTIPAGYKAYLGSRKDNAGYTVSYDAYYVNSSGNCKHAPIVTYGDPKARVANLTVNGTSGNDYVIAVGATVTNICGVKLYPLIYNNPNTGPTVTFNMGAGDDTVVVYNQTNITTHIDAKLGDGADYLVLTGNGKGGFGSGNVYGGNGNDRLDAVSAAGYWGFGDGGYEFWHVNMGAGNDTVNLSSKGRDTVFIDPLDCGTGTDRVNRFDSATDDPYGEYTRDSSHIGCETVAE